MTRVQERIPVVTCFVTRSRRVLVLRRSEKVSSYRGKWAGVSGFIESEPPLRRAFIELEEELGLTSEMVALERQGRPLAVDDDALNRFYLVHPFRFALLFEAPIRLDWEHTEFRWVEPLEIARLSCVPSLAEAWREVEYDR